MIRVLRIAAFVFVAAGSVMAAQPRIAALDLFTDENSIRAQAAATNFTALLQAELTKDFELVERAQIAAAERELHLSVMNRGSVASGLRIGKWAKADFLLNGALTTEGENRQLELTVINTATADAVSKTNIILGPKSAAPLRDFGPQVLKIAPVVVDFLKQAIAANAVREKQITISVVYARPGNLSTTDDEARAFNEWPKIVENKAATNPAVRVVRLPETRAAAAESSLMLSGLVEADPEAVTQVADYYVWTTADPLTVFHRPAKNGKGFEHFGRFSVRIWDGRSEPKLIITTNAPNSSALPALADIILQEIKQKPTAAAVTPGVREKICAEWTGVGIDWLGQRTFDATALRDRLEFNQLLRVFELASFVNPRDPLPQEQSLFLRFNALGDWEQSHQFRKSWAASEAWGAHVERFGPETRRGSRGSGRAETVAASVLYWPSELLKTIPNYVGSDLGYGMPLDASNELRREWRMFWWRELAARAKATASKAGDAAPILPYLECFSHFNQNIDQEEVRAQLEVLEGLKPAIAELSSVNARAAASYENIYKDLRQKLGLAPASLAISPVGARRAKLPRFAEYERVFAQNPVSLRPQTNVATIAAKSRPLTNEVLSAPALIPPMDQAAGIHIDLPGSPGRNEMATLAKSDGRLYVAVALAIESTVEGEARDLKQIVGAAARKSVEFFVLQGDRLVPAFDGQRLDALSITPVGDSFLFLTSNRVARVVKGKLEFSAPYPFAPGPIAGAGDDIFSLTFPNRDLEAALVQMNFKSGATTNLPLGKVSYASYGGSRILAASSTHLALSRGALEIFERAKNSWKTTELIPASSQIGPGGRVRPYPSTSMIRSGADGAFWVVGEMGLIYTQPASNMARTWPSERMFAESRESSVLQQVLQVIETTREKTTAGAPPRERTQLSAPVQHIAFEGNYTWLALADGSALLFDPATEKVAQRTYVGTYLRGFEYADKALWVGSRGGLLKYPVKPAASISASEWTPIRLSPDELNKALASMRATERAALLLMDGDRLKARETLAPKVTGAVTNAQAIHLLLTGLSFDPRHGETKQRREFLEKVSNVQGAIGDFANSELQQIAAADTNRDGDISMEELVASAQPSTNAIRFPGPRRFTNTFRPMIPTNRP